MAGTALVEGFIGRRRRTPGDPGGGVGLGRAPLPRFVGDRAMRRVNRDYRRHDATTDVLSFPGGGTPEGFHLGDVLVSVPAARRQVQEGVVGVPVVFKSSSRDPKRTSLEYADPKSSGGMIIDMGIHDFDLARWFMGEVETVTAVGGTLAYPELKTVGDIDILATAPLSEPIMRRFTAYDEVRDVLAAGPSRSTVISKSRGRPRRRGSSESDDCVLAMQTGKSA